MKAIISNLHGSHGATFTLDLVPEGKRDLDFQRLKKILKNLRVQDCIYSYGFAANRGLLSIELAEGTERLARVDGLWNPQREDQKYTVVVMEHLHNSDRLPSFTCHFCHMEVKGVERNTMEVYDKESDSMKLVSVHDQCRLIREKQIADVPFTAGV